MICLPSPHHINEHHRPEKEAGGYEILDPWASRGDIKRGNDRNVEHQDTIIKSTGPRESSCLGHDAAPAFLDGRRRPHRVVPIGCVEDGDAGDGGMDVPRRERARPPPNEGGCRSTAVQPTRGGL